MDEETNDLIVPLEEKEVIQDRATSQWFGNSDWFDGLEDGAEVDLRVHDGEPLLHRGGAPGQTSKPRDERSSS